MAPPFPSQLQLKTISLSVVISPHTHTHTNTHTPVIKALHAGCTTSTPPPQVCLCFIGWRHCTLYDEFLSLSLSLSLPTPPPNWYNAPSLSLLWLPWPPTPSLLSLLSVLRVVDLWQCIVSKGHVKCCASEDENPNCSRPAMLVGACHVMFCTSLLKSNQATKTLIEPFPVTCATFAQTFSMLDSLWCTDQRFYAL